MTDENQLRHHMVEIGRLLWLRSLVGATEGNISCRLDEKHFLCTPSGLSKGHLTVDDLVVIDSHGTAVRGELQPSSEIKVHLNAFAHRPDIRAVVHAHPLTATAFALAHRPIPGGLVPEAEVIVGPIALCPFGMPGTHDLPATMNAFLPTHDTFLLSNHGAVALGVSLDDAYWRMETLERVAQVYRDALLLGGAQPLPESALEPLHQLRESMKHPEKKALD